MHFNVYLTLYHLVDVCYFSEKVIFMESVSYYLLCLKSKMSNKRRGKTYVLLNSGLFSEKTLLGRWAVKGVSHIAGSDAGASRRSTPEYSRILRGKPYRHRVHVRDCPALSVIVRGAPGAPWDSGGKN